jgi:hypothetical protein
MKLVPLPLPSHLFAFGASIMSLIYIQILMKLLEHKELHKEILSAASITKPKPQLQLIWTPVTINKNQIRHFLLGHQNRQERKQLFRGTAHQEQEEGKFCSNTE